MTTVKKMGEEVKIELKDAVLAGAIEVPSEAVGIVLFAHGSGSSRLSPRNRAVAEVLQKRGIGTLLFDLLTPEEDVQDRRFDIPLLAQRLIGASTWLKGQAQTKTFKQAFFGASTGAAAALIAAAELGTGISSVVSRGGRPDLAGSSLPKVTAPTLLIVGGNDFGVIELNESAFALLRCEKKLEVIPHATHLFEEVGTLEQVSALAAGWLFNHFI